MGQESSILIPQKLNFDIDEWVQQNNQSNNYQGFSKFGIRSTLKNRNTYQVIDKYKQIFISSKEYQNYQRCFEWRYKEPYIVNALYMETKNYGRYCQTCYSVNVYIQHPKNRLSDFTDIPFPDTLYVLKATLIGYRKLYLQVGLFSIKEQQVCIDDKGFVKVWFNSILSKNQPQDHEISARGVRQEEKIVSQIIKIVAINLDVSQQANLTFLNFYQKNKQNRNINFDQALKLIEQYARIRNKTIPQNFRSALLIYHYQQGTDLTQTEDTIINNEESHDLSFAQRQNQINNKSNLSMQINKIRCNTLKSTQSRIDQFNNYQKQTQVNENKNKKLVLNNQFINSSIYRREVNQVNYLNNFNNNTNITTNFQPGNKDHTSRHFQPITVYQSTNNFIHKSQMNHQIKQYLGSQTGTQKTSEISIQTSFKAQKSYIPIHHNFQNKHLCPFTLQFNNQLFLNNVGNVQNLYQNQPRTNSSISIPNLCHQPKPYIFPSNLIKKYMRSQQKRNSSFQPLINKVKSNKQQDTTQRFRKYSQTNKNIDILYYTVKNQIPLDPQIVNDLIIYTG